MSATENPTTTTGAAAGEVEIPDVVELTEKLSGAVGKAIDAQVGEAAKLIAKGVLDKVLTDPIAEEMRAAAVRAAVEAVAPQPEEDPVAKLKYRNLELFVSQFLAQLYRREVVKEGSERYLRWCPMWWDHGEAVARLGALWRAFERMRQGDGVEMSVWWLHHAVPTMEQLMDPDKGPFQYCTPSDGHKRRLQALPVVEIPEAIKFPDGFDEDHRPQADPSTVTSLHLPTASLQPRRVIVREFP
ncbi:DUF4913 domain-containing protein [Nocardia bovistercoris]|uniref:DUF4913 domain-containing protein n=1 Tax=Nocardia bovistercoris TaxID=2785916 RepID=A0A931IF84_9NOCA|nr:DUF4913 domain-containing protein [Nocardia bovistercoris]MBH0780344.1 DUF4913 domain-containing protein [Nocardia bovistercoris]